jgi:ribosomal protein S18 acetylase RimI-like enzyme
MALNVRFFRQSDADDVLRLYRACRQWFEDVEIDREYIILSSERADFRFIVAEWEGRIVGFVGVLYYDAVGRAELGPISVDEGRVGEGIGGALVEAMMDFLRERGIRLVFVKVKGGNSRAISFFMKLGFSQDAYLRGYTVEGDDVVQLTSEV